VLRRDGGLLTPLCATMASARRRIRRAGGVGSLRPVQLVAVGAAIGAVLGGGVAGAALKAPATVRACTDKHGTLSLMSKGKCAKGTSALRLGVQGPVGKTGA
jgi:hypothetical protein